MRMIKIEIECLDGSIRLSECQESTDELTVDLEIATRQIHFGE